MAAPPLSLDAQRRLSSRSPSATRTIDGQPAPDPSSTGSSSPPGYRLDDWGNLDSSYIDWVVDTTFSKYGRTARDDERADWRRFIQTDFTRGKGWNPYWQWRLEGHAQGDYYGNNDAYLASGPPRSVLDWVGANVHDDGSGAAGGGGTVLGGAGLAGLTRDQRRRNGTGGRQSTILGGFKRAAAPMTRQTVLGGY